MLQKVVMIIPLNQFEKKVNKTILQRGRSNYKNKQVTEIQEISPGVYKATVEGSEDYTVIIKIENDVLIEYNCNCPYDLGPICKHVVAVVLHMQKKGVTLHENTDNTSKKDIPKTPPAENSPESLEDILSRSSNEELKDFIRTHAAVNKSFKKSFKTAFTSFDDMRSKEDYKKHLTKILRTAAGRDGYIDWSATREVGDEIFNLLDIAQTHAANRRFRQAIAICTAVIEKTAKALEYSDDSNADISSCTDSAFELLKLIASDPPSEEIKQQLLDYCYSAVSKKIFSDWGWDSTLLDIISHLVKTDEEIAHLSLFIDNNAINKYTREDAQKNMYEVYRKHKGETIAENYLEQHIQNPKLRAIAIQNAYDNKNYKKAASFAQDGVRCDKKNYPGLVMDWHSWLFKISQAQNTTEEIIKYARLLFLDHNLHEQIYYTTLKENIPPEKWIDFLEKMIADSNAARGWSDTSLMAYIFIQEKWWGKLMEIVKNLPTLNMIEHYEKHLAPHFPEELTDLYASAILKFMKNTTGREHYKTACRYLRRMKKLGASKKVENTIALLKTTYPKRKALIEELNNV